MQLGGQSGQHIESLSQKRRESCCQAGISGSVKCLLESGSCFKGLFICPPMYMYTHVSYTLPSYIYEYDKERHNGYNLENSSYTIIYYIYYNTILYIVFIFYIC